MFKILFTILYLVTASVFASDTNLSTEDAGAVPQPNVDCIQYVLDMELQFKHTRTQATQNAIRECNQGTQKSCLEYVYSQFSDSKDSEARKKMKWGDTLLSCRGHTHGACVQFAHQFWKTRYDGEEAVERAVLSCRYDTRAGCLEYAFDIEKKIRSSELRAFNGAVTICNKGVARGCLRKLYEELLPQRGNLNDLWGFAVRGCTRNI